MNLRRLFNCGALGLVLVLVASSPGNAAAADLHAYWDDRCAGCHGDAGAFARRTLKLDSGQLVGTHHAQASTLQQFLRSHYIAEELIEPVTLMLTAQASAAPLFKSHCAGCHASAADLARTSLVWRDGVLTGRKSGRPVEPFLASHGGLSAAQVPEMMQTLKRVMGEVGAR